MSCFMLLSKPPPPTTPDKGTLLGTEPQLLHSLPCMCWSRSHHPLHTLAGTPPDMHNLGWWCWWGRVGDLQL